jgi:hypothetical protein
MVFGMLEKDLKIHFTQKTVIAAICLLAIILLGITIEDAASNKSIVHAQTIKGIGVGIYSDQACLNKTLSLNWGKIAPGSNNSLTVYIRNEGNSAISLLLSTSEWVPSSASSYISLNWNYTNQALKTNEVIPLELTLTVSPTIDGITDFKHQTTITAIGVN